MKHSNRANSLLLELLLVILFFMLASVTLVEMFGAARGKSNEARAINSAVLESQNLAETLYDSDDPETALLAYGFAGDGDRWTMDREEYELQVTRETEETGGGVLRRLTVTAVRDGKELCSIPSARYLPKEGTP